VRRVEWRVEPAETIDLGSGVAVVSSEAEQVARFVELARDDMASTWPETVALFLSYLWFGFSVMEIVYKRRQGFDGTTPIVDRLGVVTDKPMPSRYDDGRWGWHRWSFRAQETLWRWGFDPFGDVDTVFQRIPQTAQEEEIPLARCLHLTTTHRKHSPEGESLLLGCWAPWYKLSQIERFEAIGAQRDLAGFPHAKIPGKVISATDQTAYLQWQKNLANIQIDEQGSLITPSDRDEKWGQPLYEFELLRSAGTKQFDTDIIIGRYATQTTQRLLADFLMTGTHGKTGSFSAHLDKTRMFTDANQAICDYIGAEVTRQCFLPLVRLNGWNPALCPRLVAGDVATPDLTVIGPFLQIIFAAGVPMTDDAIRWMYDVADIPTSGLDDTLAARAAQKATMAKLAEKAAQAPPTPPADEGQPPAQPPGQQPGEKTPPATAPADKSAAKSAA
jgi:hypothetical protein